MRQRKSSAESIRQAAHQSLKETLEAQRQAESVPQEEGADGPPQPATRVTRTGGGYVADFVTPDGGIVRITNVQGRYTVDAKDPYRRSILQVSVPAQGGPLTRGR